MGRAGKPLIPPRSRRNAASPVASVAKALATLRAMVDGQQQWGVRELAAALGEPPSTVHRLLACLRIEGFVKYDQERQKYSIGGEFVRLSAAVMQRDGLRQAALPLLQQLAVNSGETAWLAVYDAETHQIAYIAEHNVAQVVAAGESVIGRSAALTDTAFGLAILAALSPDERAPALTRQRGAKERLEQQLAAIEKTGAAISRSMEIGTPTTVASVVRDSLGRPIGSIGVVVPASRLGVGRESFLAAQVRNAGARLSQRLGAKILGGASVGSWHDAVTLISELLSRDAPGFGVMPASGGGRSNLEDLARGFGAYAMTTASSLHDAREGRPPFHRRHEELRTVINLSDLQLFVITRKEIAGDLAQALATLRVSPGEQGYSAAQLFEKLRARHPAKERRPRRGEVLYFDYPEGRRQFLAGKLDALFWLSSPSNPVLQDLAADARTHLQRLDAALLEELVRQNPGYEIGTVSHARYPRWLEADAPTLVVPTVLCCRADRPEDEVYAVARSIYNNRAELGEPLALIPGPADYAMDALATTVHRGTLRLLREIGAARPAGRDRAKVARRAMQPRSRAARG